jgi:hypothetical protein
VQVRVNHKAAGHATIYHSHIIFIVTSLVEQIDKRIFCSCLLCDCCDMNGSFFGKKHVCRCVLVVCVAGCHQQNLLFCSALKSILIVFFRKRVCFINQPNKARMQSRCTPCHTDLSKDSDERAKQCAATFCTLDSFKDWSTD